MKLIALCAVLALTQTPTAPESFSAVASAKTGDASASAKLSITVNRYGSEQERTAVLKAVREGGSTAARKVLGTMSDAGFVQLGERRTPIKFASRRTTDEGELITVVTAVPILHLGAGVPDAKPTKGFDVAVAMLIVKAGDSGSGELAPAAKVAVDSNGALIVDDYGIPVIMLSRVTRAR